MSKPPSLVPSHLLNVSLKLPVYLQLTTHLFSVVENRVPYGAYARFLEERIREYFSSRRLDLAPFLGSPPGAYTVAGAKETIEALETLLKGKS